MLLPASGSLLELDLQRDALREREVDRRGRNREILEPDPGPVEQGDLVVGASSRMVAVDDGAEDRDLGFLLPSLGDGMLTLADGYGLRDLVGKDGGAGDEGSLDLLLPLGVGAHAGDMGARFH